MPDLGIMGDLRRISDLRAQLVRLKNATARQAVERAIERIEMRVARRARKIGKLRNGTRR